MIDLAPGQSVWLAERQRVYYRLIECRVVSMICREGTGSVPVIGLGDEYALRDAATGEFYNQFRACIYASKEEAKQELIQSMRSTEKTTEHQITELEGKIEAKRRKLKQINRVIKQVEAL